MAESAISFLFNELSIWLHEEKSLLGGLEEEVDFIRMEIGQMRAFLSVADAKEESDPQLKEWVTQVREIAYDIEDVLERYMLRFAPNDARGFRGYLKQKYVSMKNLKARHLVASEIKKIRSKVENASMSYEKYKNKYPVILSWSSSNFSRNTSYDGRGDALLLEEMDVVGFEKPKKQLLEWLSSTDYTCKVISVVGMAGLGKTTLVKKVYDDSVLNFNCHAWVAVSESFEVKNLLEDIIKQLVRKVNQQPPSDLETMTDYVKREFIYNFLQNKNYIVVLDDVWRTNVWEAMRYAFPRSSTHGRGCIIITSRFSSIGNAACIETNGHVYNLEPLREEESKKLFYRKAFPGIYSCPLYLEEISESILRRCEGWPLAIVVIGGLLATKNNKIEEWEMFNRSISTELEGDNFRRMWKLLSLSFYDLPYYLKTCFLYLGIYSEDQAIKKTSIERLWCAEGFVQAKHGKTMEEMAESYLNELVNRNLVQIMETCNDGRPKKFHIHDIVREYIISKAREQNVAVVDSTGEIQWADIIRRLAIHCSNNCALQMCRFKHLRSLLFLGPVDSNWLQILHKVLCGGCGMLKVLDLKGTPLDTIPNEVFKLYHLKYLSLRNTQVKVIPKAIGNLIKLETLDLKRSMVTELPIEILKLQRLRNLLVYRYKHKGVVYRPFDSVQSFKAPNEMGRLVSLQKLCYIDADDLTIVREIGKLTQLQRLCISKLRSEDGREFCCSLTKLTRLHSLVIHSSAEGELLDLDYSVCPSTFPFLRTLELSGYLENVPQWIPSLSALTRIDLRFSRLREDPLESFQGLPNLQKLSMDCGYEGNGLIFKAGGFQKLKELNLSRLRELRWVRLEKGSMPILRGLFVKDCKLMVKLPVDIEHFTNLLYVLFVDMSEEFVERVLDQKSEQESIWKVAHIPLVVCDIVNGRYQRRF